MQIKIDIISILRAVKSEYGNIELIKRMKSILGIDLTYYIKDNSELNVSFTKRSIIINDKEPFPIFSIRFDEEYYVLTKTYESYETNHFYDYNNNLFRRIALFEIDNKEYIGLDEMDDERFKSRRIIKTYKKDDLLTECSFEKEKITIFNPHIEETYSNFGTEERKVIKLPRNIATYHKKNNGVIPEVNQYIESASSINTPEVVFNGRNNKSTLLTETQERGIPNIQIRGTTKVKNELRNFKVEIKKIGNHIFYNVIEKSPKTNREYEDEYNILSRTRGEITIADLEFLIDYTEKYVDSSNKERIIEELINLKRELQGLYYDAARKTDFFDLRFVMYPDFDHLSFDIYSNLDKYKEKIEEMLNSTPPSPTLKKV